MATKNGKKIKDWLIENAALPDKKIICLFGIDFGDYTFSARNIKARNIWNDGQEANFIDNENQKALIHINNICQKAEIINNAYQKAENINNRSQKIIKKQTQFNKLWDELIDDFCNETDYHENDSGDWISPDGDYTSEKDVKEAFKDWYFDRKVEM